MAAFCKKSKIIYLLVFPVVPTCKAIISFDPDKMDYDASGDMIFTSIDSSNSEFLVRYFIKMYMYFVEIIL